MRWGGPPTLYRAHIGSGVGQAPKFELGSLPCDNQDQPSTRLSRFSRYYVVKITM